MVEIVTNSNVPFSQNSLIAHRTEQTHATFGWQNTMIPERNITHM